jgi:hypothetical protein
MHHLCTLFLALFFYHHLPPIVVFGVAAFPSVQSLLTAGRGIERVESLSAPVRLSTGVFSWWATSRTLRQAHSRI